MAVYSYRFKAYRNDALSEGKILSCRKILLPRQDQPVYCYESMHPTNLLYPEFYFQIPWLKSELNPGYQGKAFKR